MEISIVISSLSLIVAATTLYMNQFRKAKIKIILGPDIHMYHPSDGGTAFYLPVIFTNRSPTKGLVKEIFLKVECPDKGCYFMLWKEEVSISLKDMEYVHTDRAKPFTIDGYATTAKTYWFLWPQNKQQPLTFKQGEYTFTIMARTAKGDITDVQQSEKLTISAELERVFLERMQQKDATTRYKYFDNKTLVAAFNQSGDCSFLNSPIHP